MDRKIIIIILIILIIGLIIIYKKQENLDSTTSTPVLSNEAIQTIASVYNNQNMKVTNLEASGTITGNFEGSLSGDLIGNVTGDVSGNITSDNININAINDIEVDKTPRYIWGINSAQQIFRCKAPCETGAWEEPNKNARLIDISVGKDYIYGINAVNEIYACKKPCDKGEWFEPNKNARLARIVGDNSF